MSLLNDYMSTCTLIDKIRVPDGMGGYTVEWHDGAQIECAIRFDNSMQARVAEKQGVTSLYTIVTKKNINLQYHDVLRREEDGKIFRVTSDGDDNKTPPSASLNMREVSAEQWVLPND